MRSRTRLNQQSQNYYSLLNTIWQISDNICQIVINSKFKYVKFVKTCQILPTLGNILTKYYPTLPNMWQTFVRNLATFGQHLVRRMQIITYDYHQASPFHKMQKKNKETKKNRKEREEDGCDLRPRRWAVGWVTYDTVSCVLQYVFCLFDVFRPLIMVRFNFLISYALLKHT